MRLALLILLAASGFLSAPDDSREKLRAFLSTWELAEGDVELQAQAIHDLKGADSLEAAKVLVKILEAKEIPYPIEDAIQETLGAMRDPKVVKHLSKRLDSGSKWQARVVIARCLKDIADPAALPGLHESLDDKRWAVRSAAVGAIRAVRRLDSIDPLIARLKKEDYPRVAGEIQRALTFITQKELGHYQEWKLWWEHNRETFELPPLEVEERARPKVDAGTEKTKTLYGSVISARVIFVIDISESMKVVLTEGPDRGLSRLQIVKRELCMTVLHALPEKAQFNVIAYGTEIHAWKGKLVEATGKARGEACQWVEALELAGETNIMEALDLALAERYVDTIYFLSDGSPSTGRITNPTEILADVRKKNGTRNVVINSIALLGGDGTAYNLVESKPLARNFLQKLAEQNGGSFTVFE